MYAWKTDIGIWPNDGYTNVSELVITDKDVPFVIPTADISNTISANSSTVGYSGVYDSAFAVLGQDVDTLYGAARTFVDEELLNMYKKCLDTLRIVYTSITLAYPNMWNYALSGNYTVTGSNVFYYFRQLERLIVIGRSSDKSAVYNVEKTGELTKLNTTLLNSSALLGLIVTGNDHSTFSNFCCFDNTKELTYENLIDENNYARCTINANERDEVSFYISKEDVSSRSDSAKIAELLFSDKKIEPDWTFGGNDPFEPGGDSDIGGGNGDFDNTSTPIEIPNLPSVSAASTGFISLFNPTLSQLNELAFYMWSDIFDIDTLKKLFADPMDVILGLSILPVQIPTSGAREVKVGNIGTGISLNVASTQFVEVDCGTINVNEYWGAYLDYSPYTHAQIYLPYVGVRPISVDEIMGKSVNVKYHVDILTGACCCFVKCGESVLYSFNGQCSIPIPITATNYTNTINGIINVAASLGTMVATGGATAPLAAANLASTITNQMKPTVEKSGAISGPGGVMGIQTPYLILTRPRQALPSQQNSFTGYPSFITVTLGELSGYTEIHSIHLENIPATADELSEIETLLKGGVIF